jgi:hypothetical protein
MASQAGPNAAAPVIGGNTNRFQTSDVQLHVEERDQLTALVGQLVRMLYNSVCGGI